MCMPLSHPLFSQSVNELSIRTNVGAGLDAGGEEPAEKTAKDHRDKNPVGQADAA